MYGFKDFFNETCDLDLFLEVGTIAQTLKAHQDRELVQIIKAHAQETLAEIPFFKEPMGQKLLSRYLTFFTWQILNNPGWQENIKRMYQMTQDPVHQPGKRFEMAPTEMKQAALARVPSTIERMWTNWGDYFAAMGDRLASKLNNPSWTSQMIDQEVEEWHEDLAARQRELPRQDAKVALTLDHLGSAWKGWKWVDLEEGYCSQEAEAMGHCGNSGAAEGDNILSLRDPEGYAHLTFIVNDGFLGESKGRANNKPSPKYHDPIVELLKSDYVKSIKGGGYAPENNFYLDDLHEKKRKELEHKPNLGDPFAHMMEEYQNNPKKIVGGVNEFFNTTSFEDFDGKDFVLETFKEYTRKQTGKDGKQREVYVDPWTQIEEASKYWENEARVSWLGTDEMHMWDVRHGMDSSELIDKLSPDNKEKILEYLKDEVEDFDEWDEDELIAEQEDIMEALSHAADDAQRSAIEAEAYESATEQLSGPDENGFGINFKEHPWKLKISLPDVKSLYGEMQSDQTLEDGNVESYIKLEFEQPYNGFDGYGKFDDDYYNENVSNQLYDLNIR